MNNENKGSGFFSGFILGILLGAIITIFLSRKGQGSFRGALGEMLSQSKQSIREAIEEGKAVAAKKEAEYLASMEKGKRP